MGRIDKNILIAELDRRMSQFMAEKAKEGASPLDRLSLGARIAMLEEIKTYVNGMDTIKYAKDSDLGQTYHRTFSPRWKVGDVLGSYEYYSDREGEYIIGKIIDIKMDDVAKDWTYTFSTGETITESELTSEGMYRVK